MPKKCERFEAGKCIDRLADLVDETTAAQETYPNLVPNVTTAFTLRPMRWDSESSTFFQGPPQLWFDTHSQNLGTVPVDLVNDEPGNVFNPAVAQCVSWTTDLVCRERRRVGGFVLHVQHNHFHFDDFANYELRSLLADGSPDYSDTGLLATNDKVSFCLVDSQRIREDAFPAPSYATCTSAREGISPGWSDVYTSDLEGQQLELGSLTDGRYALVVDMDAANHLYESDDSDNRVEVILELSNGLHDVTILDRRWS